MAYKGRKGVRRREGRKREEGGENKGGGRGRKREEGGGETAKNTKNSMHSQVQRYGQERRVSTLVPSFG